MKKTNIIAFCLKEIPSATVGVISVLEVLKEKEVLNFRFKETLKVTEEDIAWADIIISIRGCEGIEAEIMSEGKRLNKYLIYFLDDDLLDIPENSGSAQYFNLPYVRKNIVDIMELSNCLWATNKNLIQKYGEYTESAVTMNAPSLMLGNTSPFCREKDNNKIVIGFAGSIDHGSFLSDFFKQIVVSVLELYPRNVYFEFFGARPNFVDMDERIHHIPYANNYDEYKDIMKTRNWDIGLAPLQSTKFHSCKYFNKYLEYGAIGTSGIYSKVEPYVFIVEEKETGLLVDNTYEEWINAISTLIEDEKLQKKIMRQSYENLQEMFTAEKIADELMTKIPIISTYRAPLCSSRDVRLENKGESMYWFKIKRIFKNYGVKAPFIICKKVILKIKKQ